MNKSLKKIQMSKSAQNKNIKGKIKAAVPASVAPLKPLKNKKKNAAKG